MKCKILAQSVMDVFLSQLISLHFSKPYQNMHLDISFVTYRKINCKHSTLNLEVTFITIINNFYERKPQIAGPMSSSPPLYKPSSSWIYRRVLKVTGSTVLM